MKSSCVEVVATNLYGLIVVALLVVLFVMSIVRGRHRRALREDERPAPIVRIGEAAFLVGCIGTVIFLVMRCT